MIRTYSKRLLSPFVGLVQVAEVPGARALSLDGRHWELQCSLAGEAELRTPPAGAASAAEYALVARIVNGKLDTRLLRPALDTGEIRSAIDRLCELVRHARLPFTAVDRYQYWLLDGRDDSPLALLHSCVREEEMIRHQPQPAWVAMPAAQLEVPEPERVQTRIGYMPPINYRLERQVEERAGTRPRGVWFERREGDADTFPPCLIREDWETEPERRLCERYLSRLAPRLLMLPGLPRPVRRRLETAARQYALDVERFHPLYPEVVDPEFIPAARVEARLRRATGV